MIAFEHKQAFVAYAFLCEFALVPTCALTGLKKNNGKKKSTAAIL